MPEFLDLGAPNAPGGLQGSPAAEALSSKGVDEEAGPDEVFEVSRDMFESRLRNLAFASWGDFKAALAERPTAQGYTALRGGSETVIKLDPRRVWGWVAVLMLNIFFWGIVSTLGGSHTLPQLAASVLYAGALQGALSCGLAAQVAELLRPNLVCTVAAAGLFLAWTILGAVAGDGSVTVPRLAAGLFLLCSVVPQTLLAAVFMLRLPEDPDRAALLPNLFLGVYAAALCAWMMLAGELPPWWFSAVSLLVLGWAALAAAAKLFVTPGTWGSVELVSWALNVGALAVFVASSMLTGVPFADSALPWLLYLPAPLLMSLLGAVFGRSLPVLLGALGCIFVVSFVSVQAGAVLGQYGAFGAFGVLGAAVIFVVQWLPKSGAWSGLVALLQARLAQLCGAAPPSPGCGGREAASPYFRDAAAGAPPPPPPGQR